MGQNIMRNLKKIAIGVAVVAGGIGLLACGAIAIGFGPAGIAGGSIAASIHSGIGAVAAGSPFAIAQSLGASGALGVIVTLALATSFFKKK
jgi:hypothetical protein